MKRLKRATRNDDVNSALMEFFRRSRDRNFPLTGPLLQEKAKFFADSFGVEGFAASNGWIDSWKERNNIGQQTLSGESGGADAVAAEVWMRGPPDILGGYDMADIFNADETELFYRNKTHSKISFGFPSVVPMVKWTVLLHSILIAGE